MFCDLCLCKSIVFLFFAFGVYIYIHIRVFPKIVGTPPKWMVYNIWFQHPIKMDDLGGIFTRFLETLIVIFFDF